MAHHLVEQSIQNVDDQADLVKHNENLKNVCRLCGQVIKGGRYDKLMFQEELEQAYGISLAMDDSSKHPVNICRNDCRKLYKIRAASKESEKKHYCPKYLSDISFPHSKDCTLCYVIFAAEEKEEKPKSTKRKSKLKKMDQLKNLKQNRSEVHDKEGFESTSHVEEGLKSASHGEEGLKSTSHGEEGLESTSHAEEGFKCLSKQSPFEFELPPNEDIRPESSLFTAMHSEEHGESRDNDLPFTSPSPKVLTKLIEKSLQQMNTMEKHTFFSEILTLLSDTDLSVLSHCYGQVLRPRILNDAKTCTMLYRDTEEMAMFESERWLQHRDKSLLSFIMGLERKPFNLECKISCEKKTILPSVRVVEQVYMICMPSIILPVSFLLNLTTYALTGSKSVVNMLGNTSPSGHYKVVTQWLREQESQETQVPCGDVMNVFDNEQVIGRKHAIKANNKAKISVITNKGYVLLASENCHQNDVNLKPCHSLSTLSSKEDELSSKIRRVVNEMMEMSSERYEEYEKLHYEQVFHFIDDAIHTVLEEQIATSETITDDIDKCVKQSELEEVTIVCASCGTRNRKRKIICDGCQGKDGLKKAREMKKMPLSDAKDKDKPESFTKISFIEGDNDSTVIQHTAWTYTNEP
jgi:hypothetical protein